MALAADEILAIQKLLADYNHTVDQRDGDAFAAMFVDHGSLQRGPEMTTGRDELREFACNLPAGIRHIATNVSIDGDGDRATSRAYLQVWSTSAMVGESRLLVSGIYDDRLERAADGWRFVSRVLA
jgi:SnoaL-like domain